VPVHDALSRIMLQPAPLKNILNG